MPYESLGNELESRLGRKAEFNNQEETLDFRAENWGGDPDGPLAKALAKARERAKQVRKPLKIERLPHRDQRSLKDFEADENYAETFNAETFKAEDEAIVVEGYRPKRIEAWLSAGNAVIFYVGDRAELRYNHPMSMYQERTLLPSPLQPRQSGQSIINPTGITLADVDELMQVSTGEPWNGKYVLYTDEGNFLFYEPKKFREIKEAETKKPRKRRGIKRWGKHPYARKSSRRAESFDLPETQQRILKYLSQIHPDRIHNWDPPKGLTQREIGETVGVVRTNATKHLNDLIDLGLVKMAKKRPVGERRLQKVYFPTFAGRRVGNSFASESMLLDLDGDGVIEPWEIETQEAMLTGLNHETIQPVEFEAMEKGLGDNLRQAAIEVLQDRTGWIGLDELTRLASQKMYERKRGRKKSPRSLKRYPFSSHRQ